MNTLKILVSAAALMVAASSSAIAQTASSPAPAGPNIGGFKTCVEKICVPWKGGEVCFGAVLKDTPNDDPTKFGGQLSLPSTAALRAHPAWGKHADAIAKCRSDNGV